MIFKKYVISFMVIIAVSFIAQGCTPAGSTEPTEPTVDLSNWYTYQGNSSHTGYVAVDLMPDGFSFNWSTEISANTSLNPVTVADGKVFASTNTYFGEQKLFALDSNSGNII